MRMPAETMTARLREQARAKAKALLAAWWHEPVEGLELTASGFGDRGQRLVKEGKATTRFRSVSPSQLPPETARRFAESLSQRGGSMNDLADVQATCLALNYQVYS
jgi:hypothetical protein